MSISVRIAGAGAYLPDRIVSNERIINALAAVDNDEIEAEEKAKIEAALKTNMVSMVGKVGVNQRRFYHDFNDLTGEAIVEERETPAELAMTQAAAGRALVSAKCSADQLDGIIVVGCTPAFPHFSYGAIALHRKLGMRRNAFAQYLNLGCGGAMVAIEAAAERILSGRRDRIMICASNVPSAYFSRLYCDKNNGRTNPSWLSLLLFGDAAGAMILESTKKARTGLLASHMSVLSELCGVDGPEEMLVSYPGGGSHRPHNRSRAGEHTFFVHGPKVVASYPPAMEGFYQGLKKGVSFTESDLARCYFHPANAKLVDILRRMLKLKEEQVPVHIDKYANVSAAATLVLLAEDLETGKVAIDSEQLVIFAAIGAGADGGGHVFRL